jgi:hypothetical protein
MNALKMAVSMLVLAAGLAACTNSNDLYSSGDYANSYGVGYYAPYQDNSSFHYHHSYYANANTGVSTDQ